MFLRRASHRTAARLSAAIESPVCALLEPLEGRRLLSGAGQLDPRFNGSGSVIDPSALPGAAAVVQASNGKTVVLTTLYAQPVVLERFNPDGSLDTTFAGGGKDVLPLPSDAQGNDLALAAGDKLLIAAGNYVVRVNADGTLDTSFGGGGTGYVASPAPAQAIVYDAADNAIDVAGTVPPADIFNPASNYGQVEQFSASGAVNWTAKVSEGSWFYDLAARADGTVDVTGSTEFAHAPANGQVWQFSAGGAPISGSPFASAGSLPVNGSYDQFGAITRITTSPDGWAADAGYAGNGSSVYDFVNVYRPDGSVAYSATVNGDVDIALTDDHKLVVLNGSTVERLNTDGTPDATFGNNGVAPAPATPMPFEGAGVTIGPDGKVITVGQTEDANGNGRYLEAIRYTADNTEAPFPAGSTVPDAAGVHQAENYDLGGEGVGYHDVDAQNLGDAYRSDGVDIEPTTDTGGEYDVGWAHSGEWMNYTVNAATAGNYALSLRLANVGGGATIGVSVDGVNVTGNVAVPDTGGFQNFTDVSAGTIALTAGTHVIRVTFGFTAPNGYAGNLNSFTLTPVQGPTGSGTPYGGAPFQVGELVGAENFNLGGEGVAYHDTDPQNLGGQYRPSEGVDIETNNDVFPGSHAPGYDVGWTHTGEWLNYTGTVSQSGNYDLYARVADAGIGGSFNLSVDGVDVTGPIAIPDTGSYQTYGDAAKLNIPLTAGTHVFRITFDGQNAAGYSGNLNWFRLQPSAVTTEGPLNGTPAALPGRVEAENYDVGGEGVAFHDTTGANEGGQYRTGAGEAVDIESTPDNGYAVDYTHAGEWMQYTVNVASSGTYVFDAHVADVGTGGAFHVEVDGQAVTGTLAVPDTGSYKAYTDVQQAGVNLTAGQHVVRIAWDGNNAQGYSGNLDYFSFSPTSGPVSGPYNGQPAQLPGKVFAANYDVGGQDVAYHDADPQTNDGGQYRPTEGVDIESGSEGYDVGWTTASEWLKYTVNVTTAGTYTFDARVANTAAGGSFHVEVDGVDVTGKLAVPNTGGWQTYTDVTKSGITLSAGPHVIRFFWDTASSNNYSGNLAWFRFA